MEALSRQTADNGRYDEVSYTGKVVAGAKEKKKKKENTERNNIKTTVNGVFQ